MRALDWFLGKFPTPARVRERRGRLVADREAGASAWAARYFEPGMQHAARAVANAFAGAESIGVLEHGPSVRLIEDLKMTDLEPVEVVLWLEEKLKIQIPDKEVENLATMSDWVRYVYASCRNIQHNYRAPLDASTAFVFDTEHPLCGASERGR